MNEANRRRLSIVTGIAALVAFSGVEAYRWQDWEGVPRCLPWQTVDDGCDRHNVPCPEGFRSESLCTEGKLFYPGEIGMTGWWHRAWFVKGL